MLTATAVDIDAPGVDPNSGSGRVNPVAALAKAQELFGTTPPAAR